MRNVCYYAILVVFLKWEKKTISIFTMSKYSCLFHTLASRRIISCFVLTAGDGNTCHANLLSVILPSLPLCNRKQVIQKVWNIFHRFWFRYSNFLVGGFIFNCTALNSPWSYNSTTDFQSPSSFLKYYNNTKFIKAKNYLSYIKYVFLIFQVICLQSSLASGQPEYGGARLTL